MTYQTPKGTKDILGQEVVAWQKLEAHIQEVCRIFGFYEIRTPVFEYTELFTRSVGEATDVVQKEMYTFNDKSDRSLTLRPEMTAGAARAVVEHSLYGNPQPTRLYYVGPCFRYEKPQAGRMRQFHQFGAELYGASGSEADAEVISLAYTLLKRLDLKNIELHINSLGGSSCRSKYNSVLKKFIAEHLDSLCPACRERFAVNPLRVLDCKEKKCQGILEEAPSSVETLDKECREHFELLQKLLTGMGIDFVVDPKLVRGLDYYTRTVFEFISGDIGAQGTVCGGGRYDNLIEECGGPSMPACGFAMGMERLILARQDGNEYSVSRQLYIGHMGEETREYAAKLIFQLRAQGFEVEGDLLGRGLKAQMKYADKIGAHYCIIIGGDELASGTGKIKNMATGEQYPITLDGLAEFLRSVW